MDTSRADTGSSATIRRGLSAIAPVELSEGTLVASSDPPQQLDLAVLGIGLAIIRALADQGGVPDRRADDPVQILQRNLPA
jgi:hypothetical protein